MLQSHFSHAARKVLSLANQHKSHRSTPETTVYLNLHPVLLTYSLRHHLNDVPGAVWKPFQDTFVLWNKNSDGTDWTLPVPSEIHITLLERLQQKAELCQSPPWTWKHAWNTSPALPCPVLPSPLHSVAVSPGLCFLPGRTPVPHTFDPIFGDAATRKQSQHGEVGNDLII